MCLLALAQTCGAAEPKRPTTIQELVEAKSTWKDLIGLTLRIEGRYMIFSPRKVRFMNCELEFRLAKEFRNPRRSNVIEVTGELAMDKRMLIFEVVDLRPRPSDIETLRQRSNRIDITVPQAWYELASWARERGRFYGDDELLPQALELYETGISVARRRLREGDSEGLHTLARQAKEFELPEAVQQPLIHDAYRAEWERLRQQPHRDVAPLADRISRDLPDSDLPLPKGFEQLRAEYAASPRPVYRDADEQTRRKLHRLFVIEVVLDEIERDAAADGSNGYEIASRIERRFPELTSLAEQYRKREMDFLTDRIDVLTRQQIITLAARLEQQQQPKQAKDVKRAWLQARYQVAKSDGPRGLMELGEDTLNLVGDEAAAAKLYIEAHSLNPDLATASDWLERHGYRLRNDEWVSERETLTEDADPIARAIRDGRVIKGMTGQEVRAALGGAPTSIVRIASAGKVTELWVYAESGVSIQLARRTKQAENRVVRIAGAR